MKKPAEWTLVAVTALFAFLLLVVFVLRDLRDTPVQVRAMTSAAEAAASPSAAEKLNVNTATAQQLQTLPGIGEVLARRIIAYREENGPFRSVGELALVDGLGQKKLEAIWDLITTGG